MLQSEGIDQDYSLSAQSRSSGGILGALANLILGIISMSQVRTLHYEKHSWGIMEYHS